MSEGQQLVGLPYRSRGTRVVRVQFGRSSPTGQGRWGRLVRLRCTRKVRPVLRFESILGAGPQGPAFDEERIPSVYIRVERCLEGHAVGVGEEANRLCTQGRGLDLRRASRSIGKPFEDHG